MIRLFCTFFLVVGLSACSSPDEVQVEDISSDPVIAEHIVNLSSEDKQSSASSSDIEEIIAVVPNIVVEGNVVKIDLSFQDDVHVQGVDITIDDFQGGSVQSLTLNESLLAAGWMMVPNIQDDFLKASSITTTPLTEPSDLYTLTFEEIPTDTLHVSLDIIVGEELQHYAFPVSF